MRIAWACLASLLAGCAQFAAPPTLTPDSARWQARQALLLERQTFELNGRIAVQRAERGGSATIRWRQGRSAVDLRLSAPLGAGSYALRGDSHGATLTAPDGMSYQAADLDALMRAHFEWTLPVDGARYWMRGIPAPDRPYSQLRIDEQGRLTDLAQEGWRVSVLEYQSVDGVDLPRKMFLAANDFKIRLIVSDWTVPPQ